MKRHLSILACLLLVFAMVLTLASCEWILPKDDHTHDFQNGKCECGEVDPGYKPECTEHAWSVEVTAEATCTEPGEKTLTCTECGATEKQEIAANGHTEENLPGQAPTCVAPGLTSGKKCSVCGEILKAQTEIPTSGHNFVEGACSVCGEVDPNYNGPKTYVLDVQGLTAFAQGDKADGDTEVVSDFFTIYYSAKTKVDTTKNKTWSDGYTVAEGLRLNWGGTTAIGETTKNAVEINVNGTATVKVWWVCGGDGREVGIFDENGELVVASQTDDVFAENEGTGAGKNGVYLSEFALDKAGKYYIGTDNTNAVKNGGNIFFKIEVVVTPAEEAPVNELKVTTTDNNGWFDEYTFVAEKSGKYTFTLPAGLGLYSVASYDAWGAPEVDYMAYGFDSENPHDVVVSLAAGAEYKFYVGATTKGDWIITWTCEEGDVDPDNPGPDTPVDNNPVLSLGSNSVEIDDAHVNDGVDYTFVADVDGTYTFGGDLLAIVMDSTGTQIGRGQVSLTAGTYTVKLISLAGAGTYNVSVSVETAGEAGEPDGSEEFPYVWETIPESVVLDYAVVSGKVYYIFTATADGAVTFTWPVEGDSWFDYFELDENGNLVNNSSSGFMATSHSIGVEAGKSYRVSLGSWSETGSHTITVAFAACDHEWSEATCQVLSTCSKCGATTGDYADHIPNSENPTCADPAECTVCGAEVGYVPHSWDEGVVTQQPDCATGTSGSKLLTCTVCGATQEEDIWAYHDWVVDENTSATCTENGYYKAHCSVCNKIDEYPIEAQGHYNWYATCGETTTCMAEGCGVEFTIEHSGSPATCTDPMYCYNCWQFVGEPAGHNFVDGACSVCGEPAPVEELKAAVDNEFTSDKANVLNLVFSSGGAWGIKTNGVNKSSEFEGGIGGLDSAGKYITYEFYLSEAGTVDIIWSIAGSNWNGSGNSGLEDMANHVVVTIDGKAVNVGGIALPAGDGVNTSAWWNVQQVVLKDVQLEAGFHSFHCDVPASGGLNVGSMTINSTSTIRVDSATVTNVDFVEKDGKLYYALTIDMVGYTADGIAFWHDANTSYDIAAVETGANGETIVMIDISDFAIGTKIYPHMSFAGHNYVNDENVNGDVRGMGLEYEEKYVKFGDKYYGIVAEYTMPSLVVTTAVSQPTSVDIVEENGAVYYVLTYKVIGYDVSTFEFYDNATIYAYETPIVDGNNVTFKFNITDMTDDLWPHLRIDGTPWNGPGQNGDVKVACTTKTIELNGKTYTLKDQYGLPTVVIA